MRSDRAFWVCFQIDGRNPPYLEVGFVQAGNMGWPLIGELALLASEFIVGRCMLGVVLDRMQECPEEIDTSRPDLVPEVVSLLRSWFPVTHVMPTP